MDETRLAIAHDHYKETFQLIRLRERQRDRLFIILIVGLAVLAIQIGYPVEFGGAVETIAIASVRIQIAELPAAAVLSATWALISIVGLRYGQRVVWVEQQYYYLHQLEADLDGLIPQLSLFGREGKGYLNAAPPFQDWAWILYTVVFPIVAIVATLALLALQLRYLEYPLLHKGIDTLLAVTLLTSLYLYRLHPPQEVWGHLVRAFRK